MIKLATTQQVPAFEIHTTAVLGSTSASVEFSSFKYLANFVVAQISWVRDPKAPAKSTNRKLEYQIFPLVSCAELVNKGPYDQFLKDEDYKNDLDLYGCIEFPNDQEVVIKGTYRSLNFTTLVAIAYPPLETLNSPPELWKDGLFVKMITPSHQFDLTNYWEPKSTFMQEVESVELRNTTSNRVDILVQEEKLIDVTALDLFKKRPNITITAVDSEIGRSNRAESLETFCSAANYNALLTKTGQGYFEDCIGLVYFQFKDGQRRVEITRAYPTIQEGIAEIGGFFTAIQGVLVAVFAFFYLKIVLRTYGRTILSDSTEKYFLEETDKSLKADGLGNSSEGARIKDNLETEEPKDRIKGREDQNLKKRKAVKEELEASMVDIGLENSSMANIVKEIADFKLFKDIVLDENQKRLFSVAIIKRKRLELQEKQKKETEEKEQVKAKNPKNSQR